MAKELNFYKCSHCGNVVEIINASGVIPVCCGQPMEKLVAGATDGAYEKHVPVVEDPGVNKNDPECGARKVKVDVGSVEHPMLPEHHIMWIAVQTANRVYRKDLEAGEKPHGCFWLRSDEEIVAVYEYCNLHGLWKAAL